MTEDAKKKRLYLIRAVAFRRQITNERGPLPAGQLRCRCGMTYVSQDSFMNHLKFDHREDWQLYAEKGKRYIPPWR